MIFLKKKKFKTFLNYSNIIISLLERLPEQRRGHAGQTTNRPRLATRETLLAQHTAVHERQRRSAATATAAAAAAAAALRILEPRAAQDQPDRVANPQRQISQPEPDQRRAHQANSEPNQAELRSIPERVRLGLDLALAFPLRFVQLVGHSVRLVVANAEQQLVAPVLSLLVHSERNHLVEREPLRLLQGPPGQAQPQERQRRGQNQQPQALAHASLESERRVQAQPSRRRQALELELVRDQKRELLVQPVDKQQQQQQQQQHAQLLESDQQDHMPIELVAVLLVLVVLVALAKRRPNGHAKLARALQLVDQSRPSAADGGAVGVHIQVVVVLVAGLVARGSRRRRRPTVWWRLFRQ